MPLKPIQKVMSFVLKFFYIYADNNVGSLQNRSVLKCRIPVYSFFDSFFFPYFPFLVINLDKNVLLPPNAAAFSTAVAFFMIIHEPGK